MVVSSKCKVNIYERQGNVKQLDIDNRPLRTKCYSRNIYYDRPASRKCRAQHITLDRYDQAKQLTTFARREIPKKEQSCYYYLDIDNARVVKLREYHGGVIKYNQVYHGVKSQAVKKLNKLLSI